MQTVLQGFRLRRFGTTGQAQLLGSAALFLQLNLFSSAPEQPDLTKKKRSICKSGKKLGEKAEQVLEKVVSLEQNAPPPTPEELRAIKKQQKIQKK